MHPIEACPRCETTDRIRVKLILIDASDPVHVDGKHCVRCSCLGDLSVSDLKSEFVASGVSAQFIEGLYCERCGVGCVPEFMAKPPQAKYIGTPGGFRRVYEDGTQGPLLKRMADDPERGL